MRSYTLGAGGDSSISPSPSDLNPSQPAPDKTAVAVKTVEDINKLADAIFALSTGTAAQVAKAKADWKAVVKNKAAKGEKIYVPEEVAKKMSPWTIAGIAGAAVVGGLLLWWLLKRK